MKKLVIIPAYNEKDSIVNTVKDIKDNAPTETKKSKKDTTPANIE